MSATYTVKNGSIYYNGKLIEELGFILRKDNDSNFTSVKIGEARPLIATQLPKDKLAQQMGFYNTIVLFSFGDSLKYSISKENQVKIANFLIEFASDHRLKLQLINDLTFDDYESLNQTFTQIIEFMDKYS